MCHWNQKKKIDFLFFFSKFFLNFKGKSSAEYIYNKKIIFKNNN